MTIIIKAEGQPGIGKQKVLVSLKKHLVKKGFYIEINHQKENEFTAVRDLKLDLLAIGIKDPLDTRWEAYKKQHP